MYHRNSETRAKRKLTPLRDFFVGHTDGVGSFYRTLGEILVIKRSWSVLAGEKIACLSTPYRIKDGVLLVSVYDPIWIAELPYIKDELLVKVSELNANIRDIRFTLAKPKRGKVRADKPVRELSENEQTKLERLSSVIKNDRVREAYMAAFRAFTLK